MTTLTLIPAKKSRRADFWPDDDYDVRCDGQVVGRVFRPPQAPTEQPWFWTIVAGIPMSIHNRGYATTREEAMAAFNAAWVVG